MPTPQPKQPSTNKHPLPSFVFKIKQVFKSALPPKDWDTSERMKFWLPILISGSFAFVSVAISLPAVWYSHAQSVAAERANQITLDNRNADQIKASNEAAANLVKAQADEKKLCYKCYLLGKGFQELDLARQKYPNKQYFHEFGDDMAIRYKEGKLQAYAAELALEIEPYLSAAMQDTLVTPDDVGKHGGDREMAISLKHNTLMVRVQSDLEKDVERQYGTRAKASFSLGRDMGDSEKTTIQAQEENKPSLVHDNGMFGYDAGTVAGGRTNEVNSLLQQVGLQTRADVNLDIMSRGEMVSPSTGDKINPDIMRQRVNDLIVRIETEFAQ